MKRRGLDQSPAFLRTNCSSEVAACATPATFELSGYAAPLFGLGRSVLGAILVADAGQGIAVKVGDSGHLWVPLPGDAGASDVDAFSFASFWATTGGLADPLADTGQALWRHRLGQTEKVANLWDFEEANNPAGGPIDSNPYDVHSLGSNEALVVDAAANDLLRINKNGDVDVLAVFPSELVSSAALKEIANCSGTPIPGLEFICGLPDMMPAESVPTGLAIGPDGHYYVGELKGFPAPTDVSKIWRVSPDASNAQCGSSPDCVEVFSGGFTSIIDMAFNDGKLYVAEIDEAGWGATQFIGVGDGGTINECDVDTLSCSEVATGIPMLTAITFGYGDKLWATEMALVPGSAAVVEID